MGRMLAQAFRLHRRVKRMIQILADIFLLSTSFILAVILKSDSVSALSEPQVWLALVLALPVTLLIFVRLGLYRAVIRYMSLRALHTLVMGVSLSVVILLLAGQLTGLSLPPSLLIIYGILAMFLVGGVRFFLRSLYRHQLMRYKTRVIIYGAGAAGSQLANSLRQGSEYVPVAFVDDWRGMHGTQVEGLWVYPASKLPELVDSHEAERVLLAMPSVPRSRRRDILKALAPWMFRFSLSLAPRM